MKPLAIPICSALVLTAVCLSGCADGTNRPTQSAAPNQAIDSPEDELARMIEDINREVQRKVSTDPKLLSAWLEQTGPTSAKYKAEIDTEGSYKRWTWEIDFEQFRGKWRAVTPWYGGPDNGKYSDWTVRSLSMQGRSVSYLCLAMIDRGLIDPP